MTEHERACVPALSRDPYAGDVGEEERNVGATLDRLNRGNLDAAVVLVALGFLAATAIAYPFASDQAALPLAVFSVPPLICATLSTAKRTAIVAVASVVVATALGIWNDDISTSSLLMRMGVVVVISVLAVLIVALRARSQQAVSVVSETVELHTAFQRGLAPRVAPPPEVAVTTRYIAGEERMHLGGDFFDAICLPTGDLAFVVGDVAGHGPREAAIGAALRAGWKSAAYSAPGYPLDWIHLVAQAFLDDRRFEEFVTMCTGRVDVATGRTELISAGHVWPVVIKERAVGRDRCVPGRHSVWTCHANGESPTCSSTSAMCCSSSPTG